MRQRPQLRMLAEPEDKIPDLLEHDLVKERRRLRLQALGSQKSPTFHLLLCLPRTCLLFLVLLRMPPRPLRQPTSS